MLNKIINQKLLQASGVICIYPAYSVTDDIYVFSEETGVGEPKAVLYGLRQQVWSHAVRNSLSEKDLVYSDMT